MDNDKNVDETTGGGSVDRTGEASGNQQNGEVSYTTYKKTLTQLKNLQEKHRESESLLMQYQQKEKENEQKRLEEQGEYKKLLELERQKLNQYEQERDQYKNKLINAHKLNAFNEKLPSKISRPEYYDFVDTDSIVIDPETGMVDDSSVDNAVNSFMQNHYQLLDTKKVPMPSNSPSASSTLTEEQWLKLPLKERRARLKEMVDKER
jgi:hypothetical protein